MAAGRIYDYLEQRFGSDHDLGCQEKYIPCGIVDEDSGQLHIHFGSSYKTSDFIVDTLEDGWNGLSLNQKSYSKGIALSKLGMQRTEKRLRRNPGLPKWDVLIQPING